MKAIRGAFAWLLPALFSFSLIAPALFADSAPSVPACCRRDGKHHCAMTSEPGEASPSTAPAISALQRRCPDFPKGGAVAPSAKTVLQKSPAVIGAPPLTHVAL